MENMQMSLGRPGLGRLETSGILSLTMTNTQTRYGVLHVGTVADE